MAYQQLDPQQTAAFPDMILSRINAWIKTYDDSHYQRIADYVTLAKRNRGDYFGMMSNQYRLEWLGGIKKGLVTFPVIPRAFRSKTATVLGTNIRLEFTPAVYAPELEAGVQMAENVWHSFERLFYTDVFRTAMTQLRQLGGFAVVRAEITDGMAVGAVPVLENQWLKTQSAMFTCGECGAIYDQEELEIEEGEPDESETEEVGEGETEMGEGEEMPPKPRKPKYQTEGVRCPGCGETALQSDDGDEYELKGVPSGEIFKVMAAAFQMEELSALLFRFDDLHTIGFKWKQAHWFNYHCLKPVYELLASRPALQDKIAANSVDQWSDSARWYYELTKPKGNLFSTGPDQQSFLDTFCEINKTWISPLACHGWKNPTYFALLSTGEMLHGEPSKEQMRELKRLGKEGDYKVEVLWDIKEGETIADSFKRREPDKPFLGCCIETWQDNLINVKNDWFADNHTLYGWQIDASSANPMGEERLIALQDVATNVLSMIYSLILKSTVPKGVADSRFWHQDDLLSNQPGKWAFSKQDIQVDNLFEVLKTVGYVSPPSPPDILDMFVNLIIQIAKEESGVYDETVGGANNRNQTARGREVALNQSLALMLPPVKSEKQGMIDLAKMFLKLVQKHMPPQGYKLIKGTYDEEWKPDDIRAFRELDIDKALFIDAVEGTDVPRLRSEYEERFMVALQMGLFQEPNPLSVEIRQKIIETLGLKDVDLLNYRADRRLAARRVEMMQELTTELLRKLQLEAAEQGFEVGYEELIEKVPDPMDPNPMAPSMWIQVLKQELKLIIAQDPRTKVNIEDNHLTFIGYYTDQLKGKRGARVPRMVDILLLEDAIDAHRSIIAAQAAQEQATMGLIQEAGAPAAPEQQMPEDQPPPQ